LGAEILIADEKSDVERLIGHARLTLRTGKKGATKGSAPARDFAASAVDSIDTKQRMGA